MTAEAEEEPGDAAVARRGWSVRRKRRVRISLAILLVLIAVGLALWTQRRPIASGFIQRELTRRGVPARYDVTEIGTRTQRIENVVIGDPRRPDLVADWIVVRTSLGLSGAEVTGVEAGRVRMRGRWVGGRLSLGTLDRLMPPPSGKPFTLPELNLSVADGRGRIETPLGVVGVKLSGRGGLDDGFRGRIAMVSNRLSGNGCAASTPQAALALSVQRRTFRVQGPIRAAALDCGDAGRARMLGVTVDATLPEAMDRWKGAAKLNVGAAAASGISLAGLAGTLGFDGSPKGTAGTVDLSANRATAPRLRAENVSFGGEYRLAGTDARIAGRAGVGRLLPDAGLLQPLNVRLAAGSPGAALAARLTDALRRAGREVSGSADLSIRQSGSRGAVVVRRADMTSASGARLNFSGARGIGLSWPGGRMMLDGTLALSGGELPEARIALTQERPGAPITGRAIIAPYRAGGESLALSPVRFERTTDGATRIVTRARAALALPSGRVDGLDLPLDLRLDGEQRLAVAPGCLPLRAQRLLLSALELRAIDLRLCPLGSRLFEQTAGGLRMGVRVAAPNLSGSLGGSPLALTATRADLRVGRSTDFALADTIVRLGTPERLSRLTVGELAGRVVSGGAEGRFEGASGTIGNVPINLTEGAGDWRFVGGRLSLKGRTLRVADAAAEARYEPLAADDFILSLADGRIQGQATLTTPVGAQKVAGVNLTHRLSEGAGEATLNVEDLRFDEKGLQPDDLTRIVFGVIADVKGSVSGVGHIRWNPEGVTSDGVFRSTGTDLAAAFGPVTGVSGEIRFTDLLGLVSESAVANVASVNPGIPVQNGQIRYRLIGEQRVSVEGGRWPFANGAMVLEPTVLDLSEGKERRMTFRVEGVDAASFLQQFDFANLNASGTFDGTLPMIFDERGGRIENGRLAVRQGGGTLAYVGEVSRENLGTWGNFAFGALRSLKYENLNLVLNGPLDGEMVTEIRFSGVGQGAGAKSNFLIRRLARLPLVFNVTVRAPFRQLIDSVQSWYDPSRLIERNLPALLQKQQQQGVQPRESGDMQ